MPIDTYYFSYDLQPFRKPVLGVVEFHIQPTHRP